jgi:glycosyltransferase involved in cell wall biosynthesis
MPELIIDRRTGFIVHNIKEAVVALNNIKTISRQACLEHALNKFSSQVMARQYMELYKKVARQPSGL